MGEFFSTPEFDGLEEEQIISVNFENFDFRALRQPEQLHAYVKERITPGKMTYVFLDEIQHVERWPEVIDSLFLRKELDLYLTGSNAYLLSGEIATMISGRYVELKMLPLSFSEYVSVMDDNQSLSQLYQSYIETTSFHSQRTFPPASSSSWTQAGAKPVFMPTTHSLFAA